MTARPNILFLMTDQMQGRVLDPTHPCRTPHLDRLAARGIRFARAYTPNAVCSPARASLMTGRLPHVHGVKWVTHCAPDYEGNLQLDLPHWAQRLEALGYRTGYFGKWHVERTNDLTAFGWRDDCAADKPAFRQRRAELTEGRPAEFVRQVTIEGPEGYPPQRLYGLTTQPPEVRGMGVACSLAGDWLAARDEQPWCCFVSLTEPHDPYDTTPEALAEYDVEALEPPSNWFDDLADRPGLYRRAARNFARLTLAQKREAAACYWASIGELDAQFGRLLDQLERMGQTDRTIVVLTSDHGDFLGAHGLYQKNVGAFEEAYNIPLIVAGPGIARGVTDARVGLHEIGPTLLELVGAEPLEAPESKSFAPVLARPEQTADYQTGYAEYFGTRHLWGQRIIWDGPWKLVWNGFDFDELYHLEDDPGELVNLAGEPDCRPVIRRLMEQAYRLIDATDDHPLGRCVYASLRLGEFGPGLRAG